MPCVPPIGSAAVPARSRPPPPFYTAFGRSRHLPVPEIALVTALVRLFGELLDRHREVNPQAFGVPVMGELAAELAADDATGEQAAEAFALRRPVDGRSAALLPIDDQLILLACPCYPQAAGVRRQGPVLGGIGGKFV